MKFSRSPRNVSSQTSGLLVSPGVSVFPPARYKAVMMHHSRKYSPPRHCAPGSPLALPHLNRLLTSRVEESDLMEKHSPKAKSRMRNAKVKVKRVPSPQRPRVSPNPKQNDVLVENGGAGQRSRKKGFKPPDVRTIFEPSAKDPRVKEERGEGHSFSEDATHAFCDVCCSYIFQGGLTCTDAVTVCLEKAHRRVTAQRRLTMAFSTS